MVLSNTIQDTDDLMPARRKTCLKPTSAVKAQAFALSVMSCRWKRKMFPQRNDYCVELHVVDNKLEWIFFLLAAIARAKIRKDGRGGAAKADKNSASHFNSMRISELRRMVHDKGLDVDGSRGRCSLLLLRKSWKQIQSWTRNRKRSCKLTSKGRLRTSYDGIGVG